jgi:hypothetical protein
MGDVIVIRACPEVEGIADLTDHMFYSQHFLVIAVHNPRLDSVVSWRKETRYWVTRQHYESLKILILDDRKAT